MTGTPAEVAGTLIITFGPVHASEQRLAGVDRRVGLVGEPRIDLDRHVAVDAAGGLVTGR